VTVRPGTGLGAGDGLGDGSGEGDGLGLSLGEGDSVGEGLTVGEGGFSFADAGLGRARMAIRKQSLIRSPDLRPTDRPYYFGSWTHLCRSQWREGEPNPAPVEHAAVEKRPGK
jgi:hypothetical protein